MKAFCDVDENKIQKGFYTYEESKVRSATVDTKYNRFNVIQCKQGQDISFDSINGRPTTLFKRTVFL